MKSFKERCVELRKQDKSIDEIMKITGRPKSSVYQHIKDIPLSSARLRSGREATIKRLNQYSLKRKGKSVRTFRTFSEWSPNTVLLVAHLLFDGSFAQRGCDYNNRSEALVNQVERSMFALYEYAPRYWFNPLTGVHRISYYNVALRTYLGDKAKALLKDIRTLSPECKNAFLKAFFDDEGCMDFRPATNHRSVRGYQKNVSVLTTVQSLLHDLGIESRVVLPNEVQIVGKDNLVRFEQKVNFSPGIYMNGNRSNSRWKRHIEKRQLLRQAIESYKVNS